jgi:hypothetical protein
MRFSSFNRVIYEEFEPRATRTKQTIVPISNRVFCRFSQEISSHSLPPAPPMFLIATGMPRSSVTYTKHREARQILIAQLTPLAGSQLPENAQDTIL